MSTRGSTALAFAAISIALAFAQQQYSADTSGAASDDDVGGLEVNIPGIPGEDYPIYAEVSDTGFTCDGLVELLRPLPGSSFDHLAEVGGYQIRGVLIHHTSPRCDIVVPEGEQNGPFEISVECSEPVLDHPVPSNPC